MSLDYLMRLQHAAQNAPMQSLMSIGNTLGQMAGARGQSDFMTAAMDAFKDGDISPAKLQDFQRQYPGVPAQEIWKVAGQIGTQVEAQSMKDAGNAFAEQLLSTTPDKWTPENIGKMVEGLSLSTDAKRKFATQFVPKLIQINAERIKAKRGELAPIGAGGSMNLTTGEKIAPVREPSEMDKAIQSYRDKNPTATYDEAYNAVKHPPKEDMSHSTIVEKSKDGKYERHIQWNPQTKRYDIAASQWALVKPEGTAAEKETSIADYKKVADFVSILNDPNKEASAADIEAGRAMASVAGYDLVNQSKTEKTIFGLGPEKTVNNWVLVKKQGAAAPVATVQPPAGFTDSGRTSGGKKVYISQDGKSAWVQP